MGTQSFFGSLLEGTEEFSGSRRHQWDGKGQPRMAGHTKTRVVPTPGSELWMHPFPSIGFPSQKQSKVLPLWAMESHQDLQTPAHEQGPALEAPTHLYGLEMESRGLTPTRSWGLRDGPALSAVGLRSLAGCEQIELFVLPCLSLYTSPSPQ